jgi:hypothetical protein
MSEAKKQKAFAVYWADNKRLLTKEERRSLLQTAILEELGPDDVLLRDPDSGRLIVVESTGTVTGIFCALCQSNLTKDRYGKPCPNFAACVYEGHHRAKKEEMS